MNPLAIGVQGIGFVALLVAVQGFSASDIPVVVQPPYMGGGGGGYSTHGIIAKKKSSQDQWSEINKAVHLRIAEHEARDEEEIIVALLLHIAKTEYF